jgi:hypothetical protein
MGITQKSKTFVLILFLLVSQANAGLIKDLFKGAANMVGLGGIAETMDEVMQLQQIKESLEGVKTYIDESNEELRKSTNFLKDIEEEMKEFNELAADYEEARKIMTDKTYRDKYIMKDLYTNDDGTINEQIKSLLEKMYNSGTTTVQDIDKLFGLLTATEKELEVMKLLDLGYSKEDVAELIGASAVIENRKSILAEMVEQGVEMDMQIQQIEDIEELLEKKLKVEKVPKLRNEIMRDLTYYREAKISLKRKYLDLQNLTDTTQNDIKTSEKSLYSKIYNFEEAVNENNFRLNEAIKNSDRNLKKGRDAEKKMGKFLDHLKGWFGG